MDAADRILAAMGERLRAAREAAGLTQMEAAHAAGRDVRWWQRAEHGRVNPTVRTLVRIAAALRVPIASLFPDGGTHEPSARRR